MAVSSNSLIYVEPARIRPDQDLALWRRRAEKWLWVYGHVSLAKSWIDGLIADWHKIINSYYDTCWNNTGADTLQEGVGRLVQKCQFCINTMAHLEGLGWELVSWFDYYLRLSYAITGTLFPKDLNRLSSIEHLEGQVRNMATFLHEMGNYRRRVTTFLGTLIRLSKADRQQARAFIASLPMSNPDVHAASVAAAMRLATWKPWLLTYVYKELACQVSGDYELQEYASKFFSEMWNTIARPTFDPRLLGMVSFLAAIFPEDREKIIGKFRLLLFRSSHVVDFEQWHRVAAEIFDTIQYELERIDTRHEVVSLDKLITTEDGETMPLHEILPGPSDLDEGQWEFHDTVAKVPDKEIQAAITLMREEDVSPREAVERQGLPYSKAVRAKLRNIIARQMSG